jgi:hypothetical protein
MSFFSATRSPSPVLLSASLFSFLGTLATVFLLLLLAGCDAAGVEREEKGQFEATFRGAFDAELSGAAEYGNFQGEALLDVFTNFGVVLTDDDRRADRAIYFTRRDTSALTVGTYPLLDLVSDDSSALDPKRVWAFIFGGRENGYEEGFAYSRGGELRIEEATAGRLRGSFSFPATARTDTTKANVTVVEGTFESVRR